MHGVIALNEIKSEYVYQGECTWYALLTESGAERKTCIWLKRRQFEPYWPRFKGAVKLNRHRKAVRWRSVIAGYMFLPIPAFQTINCGLVESAPGIRKVMRNGEGTPVKIPALGKDGIERISEIEQSLNASPIAAAEGIPYKVGHKIRHRRLDLEGPILSIEKGRIVIADVYFLGSRRPIPLPVDEIEMA